MNLVAAVNQCVTFISSSLAEHEALSIKHSRSQRMWLFPLFCYWPPFNLLSVIYTAATTCSVLLFLLIFPPTPGERLLVWAQFLIHIGSGRWISPSCSPSLFHLAATLLFWDSQLLHGYSKWMNMLWTGAERIYFHKYHSCVIIPPLPPKMPEESFIISKTACLKSACVYHLSVCKQMNRYVPLKTINYTED